MVLFSVINKIFTIYFNVDYWFHLLEDVLEVMYCCPEGVNNLLYKKMQKNFTTFVVIFKMTLTAKIYDNDKYKTQSVTKAINIEVHT